MVWPLLSVIFGRYVFCILKNLKANTVGTSYKIVWDLRLLPCMVGCDENVYSKIRFPLGRLLAVSSTLVCLWLVPAWFACSQLLFLSKGHPRRPRGKIIGREEGKTAVSVGAKVYFSCVESPWAPTLSRPVPEAI